MKATEFCYWLQGHFELGEQRANLSDRQVKIVLAHLRMVDVHDKTDGRSRQFCAWLKTTLEAFGEVELSAPQTQRIKQLLSEVFLHEIDPGYPIAEVEQLQQAHQQGWGGWNSAPGERC